MIRQLVCLTLVLFNLTEADLIKADMSYTCPPVPEQAMQRFLETEDISCLEKPLLFERNNGQFKQLQCCQAAILTLGSCGLSVPFVPMASCCPFTYADEYSLRLDKDSLTFQAANNDCCW